MMVLCFSICFLCVFLRFRILILWYVSMSRMMIWYIVWLKMLCYMMLVMSGLVCLMGFLFMRLFVGVLVVSVRVFMVFMMRFIYNSCMVVNGILLEFMVDMKLIVSVIMFIVSWNWMNFWMLVYMDFFYCIIFIMDVKLLFRMMMLEFFFVILVLVMFMDSLMLVFFSVGVLLVLLFVMVIMLLCCFLRVFMSLSLFKGEDFVIIIRLFNVVLLSLVLF